MDLREKLNRMDNRTLYLNLFITQMLLVIAGGIIYFFFLRDILAIRELFHLKNLLLNVVIGIGFAGVVLLIDLVLMKLLPKEYVDDGGVNERLFRDVNVAQIALIALLVAFVEEWLFRGVIQQIIGLFWASILFAAIHYRYLHKWIYAMLIVFISFGFGYLYEWTGSMWSVISAHFLIDFILGIAIRYKRSLFD